MGEQRILRIECKGAREVPLRELVPFQGNLKKLPVAAYRKLRSNIQDYGFTAPIFVWVWQGKQNILDGHQRLEVLKVMQEDGWEIPSLPVVDVYAKDEMEAKRKLLMIASQYGMFDKSGVSQFVMEAQMNGEDLGRFSLATGMMTLREKDDPQDFLEGVSDQLPGVKSLRNDVLKFESENEFGIPLLKRDMCPELPSEKWRPYIGVPEEQEWDGWFTYTVGAGKGTKYLDLGRTMPNFYTEDEKFDNVFFEPDKFAARLLNRGVKVIVGPNYSPWIDDVRVMRLLAYYKGRWVSRYLQECGIQVIPDIAVSVVKGEEDYCGFGLPEGITTAAIQMQAGDTKDVELWMEERRILRKLCDRIGIKTLWVYAPKDRYKLFQEGMEHIRFVPCENVNTVLRARSKAIKTGKKL